MAQAKKPDPRCFLRGGEPFPRERECSMAQHRLGSFETRMETGSRAGASRCQPMWGSAKLLVEGGQKSSKIIFRGWPWSMKSFIFYSAHDHRNHKHLKNAWRLKGARDVCIRGLLPPLPCSLALMFTGIIQAIGKVVKYDGKTALDHHPVPESSSRRKYFHRWRLLDGRGQKRS